jgi:hypothetical protein
VCRAPASLLDPVPHVATALVAAACTLGAPMDTVRRALGRVGDLQYLPGMMEAVAAALEAGTLHPHLRRIAGQILGLVGDGDRTDVSGAAITRALAHLERLVVRPYEPEVAGMAIKGLVWISPALSPADLSRVAPVVVAFLSTEALENRRALLVEFLAVPALRDAATAPAVIAQLLPTAGEHDAVFRALLPLLAAHPAPARALFLTWLSRRSSVLAGVAADALTLGLQPFTRDDLVTLAMHPFAPIRLHVQHCLAAPAPMPEPLPTQARR